MKKIFSILLMLTCISLSGNAAVNGDVNGDGVCTINDVTVLYNYMLNGDTNDLVNWDQDGDGIITVGDVTVVYNILLGLVVEEHEYVDLDLTSGTLWATMNIGASTPEEFGNYFAWGETVQKELYDWTSYQWCNGRWNKLTKYCTLTSHGDNGFTDGKTELAPEDDAATANWGSDWCMPSKEQMDELLSECTWQWTTSNGVYGHMFTSKHNGAKMFLPASGYYFSNTIYSTGTIAYYWSRTVNPSRSYNAYYLFLHQAGNKSVEYGDRNTGYTVRAVRVSQD